MEDADDWDNVPPPQSRSDRIQRITSPEATLQRQSVLSSGIQAMHPGSSSSLARAAQQQQLQLAAAIMQQQQLSARPGMHHMDFPYDPQLQFPPSHMASMKRQAQMMNLQGGSLPRQSYQNQPPMFSVPLSPASSHRARYRSPSSLPPNTGQQLKPAGPGPLSPNLSNARRTSQKLELQLEPQALRQLDSLSRRGPYWGHETAATSKGPYDPFMAATTVQQQQQQTLYSGDGSTSSYRPSRNISRQAYPPSSQLPSQVPEQAYGLQHDENNSLTSQKTSRTQASMLTKSAPTPAGSGSGASGSGSGSASTPHTKQTDVSGSTTLSASAKYAEYISNLEKYQHPPPSKRHVTFIKYRGRQCTIGMLIVFAVLVIGLVVAPVVYFTAFANKAQSSTATPQARLTNFINGQMTLDTTHGSYADLMTDPGRPPDDGLKRVQRDIEDLLKDVLHANGGFAADEVSSVMVSQPQRPDAHQIFLRFQVLLKNPMALDSAEARISKAFASATSTDAVGVRLKGVPIVSNSLFFRAVPQTNGTSVALSSDIDSALDQTGNRLLDFAQFNPTDSLPSDSSMLTTASSSALTTVGSSTSSSSSTAVLSTRVTSAPTTTRTTTTMVSSTTATSSSTMVPMFVKTTAPELITTAGQDEFFGVGVGTYPRRTTLPAFSNMPDEGPVFEIPTSPERMDVFPTTAAPVLFTTTSWTFVDKNRQLTTRPMFTMPVNELLEHISPLHKQGDIGSATTVEQLPQFLQTSRIPSTAFTPPANNMPDNSGTTGWHSFEAFPGTGTSRMPGSPIQQNSPEFISGVNQANRFSNLNPGMNPPFQSQPALFNQNFEPLPQFVQNSQPELGFNNFQQPHDPSFNGNGFQFANQNAQFNPFGPSQTFPLTHFSQDDSRAVASSKETTSSNDAKSVVLQNSRSTVAAVKTSALIITTTHSPMEDSTTNDVEGPDFWLDEEAVTVQTTSTSAQPTKPIPSQSLQQDLNPVDGKTLFEDTTASAKEVSEAADIFSSTAPLLVSEWGNWSDWGACSAPRCSADGFQMRTRVCMTSINGAVAVPDHDSACSSSGGQGVEARPCVCEQPPTTTPDPSISASKVLADSTDSSNSDSTWSDLAESESPITTPVTSTETTTKPKLAWSPWSEWSACSIRPCDASGIQTRHRNCKNALTGFSLPSTWCHEIEGSRAETRPCQCKDASSAVDEELLDTSTTRRPPSERPAFQPQRGSFGLQIQNRPPQKRPTTTGMPRTCSVYEKPCNNGQCILSHRICDGFPDCADGSDEPLGCGRCFSGEFKCTNGRCISESLVCDGTDNCGDGTDEYFC